MLYLVNRFEVDCEELHRKNYDSAMLLFTAQPTRKEPEKLKIYEPLMANYDTKQVKESAKKKTGEEMITEFLSSL